VANSFSVRREGAHAVGELFNHPRHLIENQIWEGLFPRLELSQLFGQPCALKTRQLNKSWTRSNLADHGVLFPYRIVEVLTNRPEHGRVEEPIPACVG